MGGRGVLDDSSARASVSRGALIRSAIGSWRDSLINLTAANRLLNFKPSRTGTIELVQPAPSDVLYRLGVAGTFSFRSLTPKLAESVPGERVAGGGPPVMPQPSASILDTHKDPDDLASALRALMRRSNQEYLDRGLWVLYLAFGALTWIDEDQSRYTSPLLLVPVRLVAAGPRQMPVLEATEDDPVVNPALSLKLSQYGITLPRVDDLEEVMLGGLLAAVRAAVAGKDGWQVAESLVLSCFSFAKEAMYRDLLEHEDTIAAHPAVAALATGGLAEVEPGLVFDEISEGEIDTRAAPETTPAILDADASQRACIAAALGGRSFVMDGPPGTGKSQTIANMIGVLLHAGKTVLFVSEKAAALDVVRDRLTDAGLGAYLLELHSHKATRKEVAVSLGKALDTVPVAPAPMPRIDVDTARKRREQLNAYADAMNRPRDPLGYSLHDVLGMIANLHRVPAAPATGRAPVDLTVEAYGEIRATAATLAGAWRPAAQGRSFVWRGVTERGSLDARLYQAASALEALAGTVRLNHALAEATGWTRPSDASTLAALLNHLSVWPAGLPAGWLTAPTLDEVNAAAGQLTAMLNDIAARETETTQAAGATWSALPRPHALPLADTAALAQLVPACVSPEGLTAQEITVLAELLAAQADMLDKRAGTLSGLASMLGLRAPESFTNAVDLITIAGLAKATDRPERAWLSVPGHQMASEAASVLQRAHQAHARVEADASAYYTSDALSHDVERLAEQFKNHHHGLGKLSAEYRADKKIVAAFTKDGIARDTAYQQLPLAVAWKSTAEALAAAEAKYAAVLGRYYAGRRTDFGQLSRALDYAATAVARAQGQNLSSAADHVAVDATPNPVITRIAAETSHDLTAWRATLAPPPLPAARPELLNGTITGAIGWLRTHLGPLQAASAYTNEVSEAVGRPLTYGQARRIMALREAADAAHERLSAQDAYFTEVLGDLYAGVSTDVRTLRIALGWAQLLREMITGGGGPLSPVQVKTAEGAVPTAHLPAAVEGWQQATQALLQAFDPDRRSELAAELDDYDDAADLIAALREDSGGPDEWHAYQQARASLATYGLDATINFCIAERVEPGQVPPVLERALLQEWADHHLRTDPSLSVVRAADRDALVGEYQQLDKALIAAATGDIIRACNTRRPRSDIGEAAVIHREAEKKKKHMPVRVLISRALHVIQAIKPCFMMSPLAVSQYLPADMHFDVVIFDEASQVTPADAINCIYRGGALILAGDQKQLPPTNFFAPAALDDEEEWSEESDDTSDFESILDLAKACGAYKSLSLRWHYRSRHEALIAFSNAWFYEGRLITFPSRHSDGPDVGVELFWGEGTYRRGTSRDNPGEAARVAQRVIHHYDTRPALSLGVVTFSEAQADAIETALGQAREARPDLDKFFTSDRLRGFFVKSLESVQGDERDVLIFSIGYGPDENRKMTMNFGPLNKQGGWRRLNVAITRARYRNEIVSSIRAGDIPESVISEGVKQLRRYLDYAARGLAALALDTSAGGDAESPFEESVIGVIRSWGYELTPQVGTAGYRIDIGIRHPAHPGVYALGVECDGYQYHSSRTARDRDRLREKVLRGLGWHLHRIWGTAWYRDRHGEERKLRAAIEHAIAAPVHGLLSGADLPDETGRTLIETEPATFDAVPGWTVPYETAAVPHLPYWVDLADPGSRFTMNTAIHAVVNTEAPIHTSLLHQRLRDAWHIGRIGSRIRENIDAAIMLAGVIRDGDFLTLPDAPHPAVRTPTQACERTIEQVHDQELAQALTNLVRDAHSISQDELTTRTARIYGWTRRGPDITNRMASLINALLAKSILTGAPDNLTISQ
jgi:hypothetical protein